LFGRFSPRLLLDTAELNDFIHGIRISKSPSVIVGIFFFGYGYMRHIYTNSLTLYRKYKYIYPIKRSRRQSDKIGVE